MNKNKAIDLKPLDEKAITIQEPQSLDKPKKDTAFAQEAASFLVDIIKKNNWSMKLGGQSEHIMYEGWQTAGKYYGYSVKTFDAEYVEFGNSWGFKAKAVVVNELTGIEVGGAEAYCMNDEKNWGVDKYGKQKPKFQLASMAQTRAGSKALRQILGFVVALAGYNPTPAEEMEGVHPVQVTETKVTVNDEPEYRVREAFDNSPVTKCPHCNATGKYHSMNCPFNGQQRTKPVLPSDKNVCNSHDEPIVMFRGVSKSKKDANGEYKTYWWHKSDDGRMCFGDGYKN